MCKPKFTCKDCEDRHVGCHSECKSYIEQKNEYLAQKEVILKDKMKRHMLDEVKVAGIKRATRGSAKYDKQR